MRLMSPLARVRESAERSRRSIAHPIPSSAPTTSAAINHPTLGTLPLAAAPRCRGQTSVHRTRFRPRAWRPAQLRATERDNPRHGPGWRVLMRDAGGGHARTVPGRERGAHPWG